MYGISLTLILQLFGAFFILMGVAGLLSFYKNWYWQSRQSIYGYIPFGLIFVVSSFETQIRQQLGANGWLVIVIYVLLFALGVWGFVRPPQFIKPGWIRLIETQPQNVYDAMVKEVKAGVNWHQKVESPEALAEWIRTIRSRPSNMSKKK
jgi:hypothetical protein